MSSKFWAWILALVTAVAVSACGGGGGNGPAAGSNQVAPVPGGGGTSQSYTLDATVTGAGQVTADAVPLTCASTGTSNRCTDAVAASTEVTLTASASAGYTFSGWTGSCTGKGTCKVKMSAAQTVQATFDPTVSLTIAGSGSIGSNPAGLACTTAPCALSVAANSTYTLTANPATGWAFSGWTGDCAASGTGACSLTVDAAKSVSATFVPATQNLAIVLTGNGTVAVAPAGESCAGLAASCMYALPEGSTLTLTASAAPGYVFSGWGGACSGAGTCTVPLGSAKTVTASFTAVQTLSLTLNGSGSVNSAPAGLNCGSSCSASLTANGVYVLTATPADGFAFTGWSGACTGTSNTCSVTMNAARNVVANFAANQPLTLDIVGSGEIASSPAGLSCLETTAPCSSSLIAGSSYVLTARAIAGVSTFTGWSGACSGTGTCTVTMNTAKSVTANFTGNQTLSLAVVGSGTITSTSPTGYSCNGTNTPCSSSVTTGNTIIFTAAAASGFTFTGWSGACTGTGPCSVTLNAAKTLTANFTANQTLNLSVSGQGTITSTSPTGYNCSNANTPCANTVTGGTPITFTATPATGHVFTGWGGACSGTGTCAVTMSAARSVSATFTPVYALNLSVVGTGSIASSPAGYSCSNTTTPCAATLNQNTALTLTATAASGYTFAGWSGACTGTGTCAVTMNAAKTVTATFTPNQALNLTVVGTGSIASSPAGYSCSNTTTPCATTLTQGASLNLSATAGTGYTFAGWSGACSGTGTCAVTLSTAQSVTATFTPNQTLTLAVVGSGSITSSVAGTSCSNTTTPCTTPQVQGAVVTLTATPTAGFNFTGWSGACTGTGTCSVTMNAAKSVTANFVSATQPLTLTLSGNGTVSSAPAGVNCTASCAPNLTTGTAYTLTAAPASGYTFIGWGGACSGTGNCVVTMGSAQAVTANFTANQTLTLTLVGSGTVSSSPAGVNCTASCAPGLTNGSSYTLSAVPAAGFTFTGWSGAAGCTGTGTCVVAMSAAKAVTATFTSNTQPLTLTMAGSGTVSSTPGGVSCTASCAPNLTTSTAYTLTAVPASGYTFTGWSGAAGCTGTGTCAVTMNSAKAVTATFTAKQTLSLSVVGTGSVSSAPSGASCSNTNSPCSAALTGGASYTLTATPGSGFTFTGWSGACTGTGTCAVTMSGAKSVTATFASSTQALNLSLVGSGTVASASSGINCNASCISNLLTGTSVTLTATPAAGYSFTGWSGAAGCTGSGTCTVAMNAAQAVTATFAVVSSATQTLSTTVSGTGSVASAGNISCTSGTCSAAITTNAVVTLTATPSTGWKFSAWTGACTGATNTCSVTMSSAKSVTATFVVDSAAAGCNITRASNTAPAVIASTRPRIFVNHAQTLSCLQGMASANTAEYQRLKTFVDTEIAGGVNTNTNYGFEEWQAALMWRVTGQTVYRDFAIARIEKFLLSEETKIAGGTTPDVAYDSYLYVGAVLGNQALVFDWCYDGLSASLKSRLITYMNQALYNVWNPDSAVWGGKATRWSGWSIDNPYNNYHFSFLRATMLTGLATLGDNSSAQSWINLFRTTKIENALIPLYNNTIVSGGSLEGTNYGVSMRELFELYDWWERSTGERLADRTPHTLGSMGWMMHQITPTTEWLISLGDQSRVNTAPNFDYNRAYLLILMSLYPQERLSSAANLLLKGSILPTMSAVAKYEHVYDFLYKPPTLPSVALTDVSTNWYGLGTGDLFMRAAWADQSAAHAHFKCGLMTESHQHLEQGAFQIYRGEWLAPTGNRFGRGLERGIETKNAVHFVNSSGAAIQPTEGITTNCNMYAVADNDLYSYGAADITPSYQGEGAIAKSEREFLFIKPSTFVVFDRAVATSTAVKRVWSLNLTSAPTLNGNQLTYVGPKSNRMDVHRVAPTGLSYTTSNYPFTLNGDFIGAANPPKLVKVQDTAASTSTYFLHVIGTSTSGTAPAVSSVTSSPATGQTGAVINLADGRVVTVRFSNAGRGGTLEIKSAAGAVLSTGNLPTTVTMPPALKN